MKKKSMKKFDKDQSELYNKTNNEFYNISEYSKVLMMNVEEKTSNKFN